MSPLGQMRRFAALRDMSVIAPIAARIATSARRADGIGFILIFRNCACHDPKSVVYVRRLAPLEGRIAIVTDAGRDAVDAASAIDEQR